ncbi:RNA dependent RNA polymerase-domain-containing protein [Rhodofomes roseus]|uniref:RNA-dependent RNA polymerase n=1 Tax=Rhodofomes roseus TaxID=34475 RepID=A0ABQ8K000_9APHY|nr:RNA dependent RNA polymerase-domain-containing protein [Rhodofomes roseus]KAH9829378.1 RNA dependent RNA polymerase-domain-containing protein [Rhodofomes roseus]
MEVFMQGIPFSMEQPQLKELLASVFHGAAYSDHSPQPLNFEVRIYRKVTKRGTRNGVITVPTTEIGEQFLREYGQGSPRRRNTFDSIVFARGIHTPNRRVLETVQQTPYRPSAGLTQPRYDTASVSIQRLQFGWICRDEEYSVEWEKKFTIQGSAYLRYNEGRRQFQMIAMGHDCTRYMAIRPPQVYWTAATPDQYGESSIFFYLLYPPSFEEGPVDPDFLESLGEDTYGQYENLRMLLEETKIWRLRKSGFDDTHVPIAPYTSIAVRLVCKSASDVALYRVLCRQAHLTVDSSAYTVVHRGLFARSVQDVYRPWVANLDFAVASQVESLLRKRLVDMQEIVRYLRPSIDDLMSKHGPHVTRTVLADLKTRLEARLWYGDGTPLMPHADLFLCTHVHITPTTIIPEGPFPEQSNRVIRKYWDNRDNFIRVHFTDDNRLAYRYDSELNLQRLIEERVKHFLVKGVTVAGRHFQFLGYSQSALKSHSVWFVRPFQAADGRTIDAAAIIAGLGSFNDNPYDPQLIYCPARYAARISQAFSATASSITVAAHEMEIVDDIKDRTDTYSFTDGNGTMSLQVARDIAADQRSKSRVRRAWRGSTPRVIQVRVAGSKGMLHVDHKLEGRKIRLPRSMVKFSAPTSNQIDIAQVFEEPSRFNLNRPMIMLLKGLGVPYEAFKRLQDDAVRQTHTLTESLANSRWLLEMNGLGGSFKIASIVGQLHKLGVTVAQLTESGFWQRMMTFAVNHILRELKDRASIPVPGGWTLVGVADIHGQLREGEIYACVQTSDNRKTYLEGPTLITRSPVIHPGDIQVVHAIGRPPVGSDLARGRLKNCVVFSTRGTRPLPSYLGGGDLDGDMYHVTCVPQDLLPPTASCDSPASYNPAKRKILNRPSTMQDVATFVAEFIISDNVGLIASTWLTLADNVGILDRDCLRLAELHNAAVDYPKTGLPVDINAIRPIQRRVSQKPDWYTFEATVSWTPQYYQSNSALGRLFRAIDLPALEERSTETSHFDSPEIDEENGITLADVLADVRTKPHLPVGRDDFDESLASKCWNLFTVYASRLRGTCASHTVSASRSAMLSEEEVVIGTISAKSAQARKRADMIEKVREQTATLVNGISAELSGGGHLDAATRLEQAWMAYRVSCTLSGWFGGQSFAWIALGGGL